MKSSLNIIKMQTIARKNVAEIYNAVCQGWQQKIDKIMSDQKFSDTIEVDETIITAAFKEADANHKKILNKYFENPKSIFDKIQTIEDVLRIVGKTMKQVCRYANPKTKEEKAENARNLVTCITEAYNQGVKFDWKNSNQYKYYPWFEKKALGGWVLDCVGYRCTCAYLGSGFYFVSEDACRDAVKKFMNIYLDYLPE
jgi:hypothetical protein